MASGPSFVCKLSETSRRDREGASKGVLLPEDYQDFHSKQVVPTETSTDQREEVGGGGVRHFL